MWGWDRAEPTTCYAPAAAGLVSLAHSGDDAPASGAAPKRSANGAVPGAVIGPGWRISLEA